jgi:hypothetical protein
MHLPVPVGVVLLLLMGTTGCAHSPERETADFERAIADMERLQDRAADILRIRSDADSLAAAALFIARHAPDDALTLIARATTAAPERPELALLHAKICADTHGCDPEPIEARLRQLDPANGIGWFGAIGRAFEAADDAALDAALTAASHSQRVDSYYMTLTARLSAATASAGALSLPDAIGAVIGEVVSVISLPGYTAASKGCGTERLERLGLRDTCRPLSASLMAGDTFLTEMIGVAIAKRTWPVDSPEWQAASEARRVYRYRSEALLDTYDIGEWDEAKAGKYLQLVAQHPREQDLVLAQLIALGIDPMPPADWTDAESP